MVVGDGLGERHVAELVLQHLGQVGSLPRIGRLQRQQKRVERRVRDPRRVVGHLHPLGRERDHLLRAPRHPDELVLEDRLAKVFRQANTERVGFTQEGVAAIADARRQVERDPPVFDVGEVCRQGGDLGRRRLQDDDHVARRRVAGLPVVGRGAQRPDEGREDGEPHQPDARGFQWGTWASRWIVGVPVSRVAKKTDPPTSAASPIPPQNQADS